MRGRTALYGRRHLLQLVAIKRLQAKGLTLAEVQAQLAGASTRVLEHVASIADDVAPPAKMSPVTGAKEIGGEEIERDTESFWSSLPSDDVTPVEATGPREPRQSEEEVSEPPALLNGMRIGQDLVLLLSPKRAIEDDDVRALEAASEPLVRLLRERGLI
jgi:DNA-binding transcriptional MerR regulator